MQVFISLILPVLIGLSPILANAAIDPIVDAEDHRQVASDVIKSASTAKDPSRRARAALAFGRIQNSAGIDPLILLLKDKSADVRESAAFALGQFGWQEDFAAGREGEILTELSTAAKDSSEKVRLAAVAAIGKVGLANAPDLVVGALNSTDAKMRAEAVLALFRYKLVMRLRDPEKDLGDLPLPIFERLVELAADSDTLVKRNVAYYFARVADSRGEKTAAQLATAKDKWTRVYALMGLARMKAKNSREVLDTALADREYSVRLAAATAMIAVADSFANHLELRKDPSYLVRVAYAQGLDPLKAAEATELARLLRWDSSPTVRAEALKVLAKIKSDDLVGWLVPHAHDSRWVVREAAVAASEKMAPADREKFLLALVSDSIPLVRAAAQEALYKIPTTTSFAVLNRKLESPQLIERGTAVTGLKERKESDLLDLAWKTYGQSVGRQWVELRQELVDFIGKIDSSTTTDYLRKILKDDLDRSVQIKALKILEARKAKDLDPLREQVLTFSPYREMTFKKNPKIVFRTERGDFTIECFAKSAPIHVASLVGLVKKQAYDGLIWHRVVPNFVVQGGDPDGTGAGDSGYSLRAEINPVPYDRGSLGMPRSQAFDTGGSQLFFTPLPTPHLDGQYTVFGRVIKGAEVLDKLERGDKIISARLR